MVKCEAEEDTGIWDAVVEGQGRWLGREDGDWVLMKSF